MAIQGCVITDFEISALVGDLIPAGEGILIITSTDGSTILANEFSVGGNGVNKSANINSVSFQQQANSVRVSVQYSAFTMTGATTDLFVDIDRVIPQVFGCTNSSALNYDPNATADDGSCFFKRPGCRDPNANNYDPLATTDDGSCEYDQVDIPGCTNPDALNYNIAATVDDGSCQLAHDENVPDEAFGFGIRNHIIHGASQAAGVQGQYGQLANIEAGDDFTIEYQAVNQVGTVFSGTSNPDQWVKDLHDYTSPFAYDPNDFYTSSESDINIIHYSSPEFGQTPPTTFQGSSSFLPDVDLNKLMAYDTQGTEIYSYTFTAAPGKHFANPESQTIGISARFSRIGPTNGRMVVEHEVLEGQYPYITKIKSTVFYKVPPYSRGAAGLVARQPGLFFNGVSGPGVFTDSIPGNIGSWTSPVTYDPVGALGPFVEGQTTQEELFRGQNNFLAQNYRGGMLIIWAVNLTSDPNYHGSTTKLTVHDVAVSPISKVDLTGNYKNAQRQEIVVSHDVGAFFYPVIKDLSNGKFYDFETQEFDFLDAKTRRYGADSLVSGRTKTKYKINIPATSTKKDFEIYIVPTGLTVMNDRVPTEANPKRYRQNVLTTITLAATSTAHAGVWTFGGAASISGQPGKTPGFNGLIDHQTTLENGETLDYTIMDGRPGYRAFTLTAALGSGSAAITPFATSKGASVPGAGATANDLSTPTAIDDKTYRVDFLAEDGTLIENDVILESLTTTYSAPNLSITGLMRVRKFGTSSEAFTIDIDNFITTS